MATHSNTPNIIYTDPLTGETYTEGPFEAEVVDVETGDTLPSTGARIAAEERDGAYGWMQIASMRAAVEELQTVTAEAQARWTR